MTTSWSLVDELITKGASFFLQYTVEKRKWLAGFARMPIRLCNDNEVYECDKCIGCGALLCDVYSMDKDREVAVYSAAVKFIEWCKENPIK